MSGKRTRKAYKLLNNTNSDIVLIYQHRNKTKTMILNPRLEVDAGKQFNHWKYNAYFKNLIKKGSINVSQ